VSADDGVSAARGIALRPAQPDDAARLFAWANDPATRGASFDRAPIAWPEHVAWLAAVLADPDRRLWIAEEAGVAVGQLRVDRTPDGLGTVSIGLAPVARGRGLGRTVLRAGLAAAVRELGISRARAVVMAANLPSRRLFEGAGFVAAKGAEIPGQPTALVLVTDAAVLAADPGLS
jgi:UDP-2,4-diacetamido-2,4,6-trideoxy-beta-L-altropyranose hydrolase